MSYFEIRNLTAGYGKKTIIENISADADAGEIIGILGPNGCGKTTLLKSLCGILPHTGTCALENAPLEPLSVKERALLCGYIPQTAEMPVSLSVLDTVLMGFNPSLRLLEYPDSVMRKQALSALAAVDMDDLANTDIRTLSLGQRQLVFFARLLALHHRVLFLDEPESALDFHHRYELMHQLKMLVTDEQSTAFVTLHDLQLALNTCDRILLMKEGQLLGDIAPARTDLSEAESLLSEIYGAVSLQKIQSNTGKDTIVVLSE